MWRFVKRAAAVAGLMSAGLAVFASKEIPVAIKDADGVIYTNLKWICDHTFLKCQPPVSLASTATDDFVKFLAILLALFVVTVVIFWVWEKLTPSKESPVSSAGTTQLHHGTGSNIRAENVTIEGGKDG